MNNDVRSKTAQIEAKKAYLEAVKTGDPVKIEAAEKNVYYFQHYDQNGRGVGLGWNLHFVNHKEQYQNG